MKIVILNGPNLNLQGTRSPEIYGTTTFEQYMEQLQKAFPTLEFDYFQSNHEGELIDKIHAAKTQGAAGIVFNAVAYTHTSVALHDAISAVTTPVVEVHISSILAREYFRHHSMIAPAVIGSIMGFGLDSYRLGVEAIIAHK